MARRVPSKALNGYSIERECPEGGWVLLSLPCGQAFLSRAEPSDQAFTLMGEERPEPDAWGPGDTWGIRFTLQ